MLTLNEALQIVKKSEPRMEAIGGCEYETAFVLGLAPIGTHGGFANSCYYVVWKDSKESKWIHFSERDKLFEYAGFHEIKRFELKELLALQ